VREGRKEENQNEPLLADGYISFAASPTSATVKNGNKVMIRLWS
jgi:hypothetical protein